VGCDEKCDKKDDILEKQVVLAKGRGRSRILGDRGRRRAGGAGGATSSGDTALCISTLRGLGEASCVTAMFSGVASGSRTRG
jgi:hypothetical protein